MRDLDAEMTTPAAITSSSRVSSATSGKAPGSTGTWFYLDAAGDVRQLPARWRILEHMKLSSTVAGSLAVPVLKDLSAAIAGQAAAT